ncbi:Serine/arginine repetitive matrix protein 2 [Branchiostoma belcheri]|nr:Serine/arginine repetitive matrix protein 2 [Branchiostoma belcheri]
MGTLLLPRSVSKTPPRKEKHGKKKKRKERTPTPSSSSNSEGYEEQPPEFQHHGQLYQALEATGKNVNRQITCQGRCSASPSPERKSKSSKLSKSGSGSPRKHKGGSRVAAPPPAHPALPPSRAHPADCLTRGMADRRSPLSPSAPVPQTPGATSPRRRRTTARATAPHSRQQTTEVTAPDSDLQATTGEQQTGTGQGRPHTRSLRGHEGRCLRPRKKEQEKPRDKSHWVSQQRKTRVTGQKDVKGRVSEETAGGATVPELFPRDSRSLSYSPVGRISRDASPARRSPSYSPRRVRGRSRSYSPIIPRRRNRDSPSHLEPRRITSSAESNGAGSRPRAPLASGITVPVVFTTTQTGPLAIGVPEIAARGPEMMTGVAAADEFVSIDMRERDQCRTTAPALPVPTTTVTAAITATAPDPEVEATATPAADLEAGATETHTAAVTATAATHAVALEVEATVIATVQLGTHSGNEWTP